MPDTRPYARQVVIALAIGAAALAAWRLADVFLIAFAGIIFAMALRELARPLARLMPERGAIALTMLLLIAAAVAGAWLFGSRLGDEVAELYRRLPQATAQLRNWIETTPMGSALLHALQRTSAASDGALRGLTRFASGTLGVAANTVLVCFLALYFALEPRTYLDGALRLIPPPGRDNARQALAAAGRALRQWLTGQGLAMLCVGTATGLGLALAGVPLALTLGIVAGIAEFVPIIGPIVSAVPGILVGFSVSPETALYATLVYLVVQQLEGNIITPLAQQWAVALPPAVAVLSVVAFGLLFGVPGILFATPLSVVTMVLVRELYVKDVLENSRAARGGRQ